MGQKRGHPSSFMIFNNTSLTSFLKHLYSMYNQVKGDLTKILPLFLNESNSSSTKLSKSSLENTFYIQLLQQTLDLVALRMEMLQIYKALAMLKKSPNYEELIKQLDRICVLTDTFTHPYLYQIKVNSVYEFFLDLVLFVLISF